MDTLNPHDRSVLLICTKRKPSVKMVGGCVVINCWKACRSQHFAENGICLKDELYKQLVNSPR